jgi:hypothetical protein
MWRTYDAMNEQLVEVIAPPAYSLKTCQEIRNHLIVVEESVEAIFNCLSQKTSQAQRRVNCAKRTELGTV